MINGDLCDRIIDNFIALEENAVYDSHRGYYRLTDKDLYAGVLKDYKKAVNESFDLYKKAYKWSNVMTEPWGFFTPFNIQKYNPGEAYRPIHTEDGGPRKGKFQRKLVFTTYLNDIKEGGETEFLLQGVKIKPQKGLTVIWPAGWTHPHRGIPAPNETKYIATGWACYHSKC